MTAQAVEVEAALTPAEVAARAGCSVAELRRLAREYVIEHQRVGRGRGGGKVMFTPDQADAAVRHFTIQPAAPVQSLTTARSRARRTS